MPDTPVSPHHADEKYAHQHLPHIGMRKVKSVLAILVGFCIWQLLRLFIPGLEVHPLFIYIYGVLEMRETSAKTVDYGKARIMATFVAIITGLPFMFLADWARPQLTAAWSMALEITIMLLGTLLVLCVAEQVKCRMYCGLAAAIYIILMITHFESRVYLYSIMRAFQTIIGVGVAWLINVKLLPYPVKSGTLRHLFKRKP